MRYARYGVRDSYFGETNQERCGLFRKKKTIAMPSKIMSE